MNLNKDGENKKNYFTVLWYFDVIGPATSFLISCIGYLTSTFSMKVFLKKLDIHVFLVKQNSLLKNTKGNSFTVFPKMQTGSNGTENRIQKIPQIS